MNVVYGALISPFVRKVLMTLDYKQIPYELVQVPPHSTDMPFAKISPLGKIPAFADEYVHLADSSVICDYIEHKYPQRALYPKSPVERAKVLWLEEYADTTLMPLLGPGLFFERFIAPAFYRRAPNQALIDASLKAIPAVLDYLEPQIPQHGFIAGPDVTIADLILPGAFINAEYVGYTVDAKRWPRLAAYIQRMAEHPLYAKYVEQDRAMVSGALARLKK